MAEVSDSSGIRRICPRCGYLTEVSGRYCRRCGFGFETGAPSNQAPLNGAPPEGGSGNRSVLFAVVTAVIAGVIIGGFLLYRIVAGSGRPARSGGQSSVSDVPSMSAESTSSTVRPAPEGDALAEKSTSSRTLSGQHRPNRRTAADQSNVDTLPVLIDNSTKPAATATIVESAPVIAPAAASTPMVNPPRRHTVQETDAEQSPMPAAPTVNGPAALIPPGSDVSSPAASEPPTALQPLRKPVYEGPMAGMATWTGKLEKNGTLMITGGTPSTGVLSGAGLPGVPVRLTVDQTNLGFLEMPSATNGYRRLVLKSHSSHDRITIHWTVVQ